MARQHRYVYDLVALIATHQGNHDEAVRVLTEMHAGLILRGLRHQRRLTLEQLAGPQLRLRRLQLIEDGVEPAAREMRALAAALQCSPLVLAFGISAKRAATVRAALSLAQEELDRGMTALARQQFGEIVADLELGSRPDLWVEAELGLALAEEADGDLTVAIARLTHLLEVVAPLHLPLPPMTFENREETEQRIVIAMALCRCLRETGDLTAGIALGERAFARELLGGWSDRSIELGATLLAAYIERGEMTTCQALTSQLLDAADKLNTPRAQRAACWNGATVAAMVGNAARAEQLGQRALEATAQINDSRSVGRLRGRLAWNLITYCPGEHERARTMLLQAHSELVSSAASAVDVGYCEMLLARTELLAGRAAIAAQRAQEIADRHPDAHNLIADAQLLQAEALQALQEPQAASVALTEASDRLERMNAPSRAARALIAQAENLHASGDVDGSMEAYQRAMDAKGLCT